MEVIIIEDEIAASKRLVNMLKKIDPGIEILSVFDSIEESVDYFASGKEPDLIFADIQLSDGLCFEIFRQVQVECAVIFTTAFDEYAIEAFKVNSIDYLLKPIGKNDLEAAIKKFQKIRSVVYGKNGKNKLDQLLNKLNVFDKEYKSRFLVKTGQTMKIVTTDHIAYFYIENQLVFIIAKDGNRYLIEHSLDELETMLDPEVFFRINRQMIISLESVKTIHPYFNSRLKLVLNPEQNEDVLVSRLKVSAFKKWLDR